MSNVRLSRRLAVAAVVVALFGVVTSAVVASHFRDAEAPTGLEEAIRAEPLVKVAEIPAVEGFAARGVYAQPTSAGFLCLWDATSASSRARQGGCNRLEDPFVGMGLFASLAYDGGPDAASVRDARLIGLVPKDVASVEIVMTDGTRRSVRLKGARLGSDEFKAFGYRFSRADLRRRLGPTAIVALDAAGSEVGRQPTGFGN
jgi:hypothetical protein